VSQCSGRTQREHRQVEVTGNAFLERQIGPSRRSRRRLKRREALANRRDVPEVQRGAVKRSTAADLYHGAPLTIPKAICMHEEDVGVAWKHTDFRTEKVEVRRSRRLVVCSPQVAHSHPKWGTGETR